MLVRDVQHHIIGNIDNGVFVKKVWGFKHFLRNPEPSIAIDAQAFDNVISRHARSILVIDRETFNRYEITTGRFNENKVEIDRKYGRQYYVPIRLWDCTSSPQKRLI